MSILLLGDSHLDIFRHIPGTTRFDFSQCELVLFTTKRFLDDTDTDLWSKLTPWFENNKADVLLITAGEIDLRAHFWRHLPRHYKTQTDIEAFVKSQAEKFYNKLCGISDSYGIKKIIVWGSPTAGEKAVYNSHYPFSGSSKTRNILTHMWNREFSKYVDLDNRFSLCSAFYHFIQDDYNTMNTSPSHDGVHWQNEVGTTFWDSCIKLALNNSGLIVGPKWTSMVKDNFDIIENQSNGRFKYDTWAKTSQLLQTLDSTVVNIKEQAYTFVKAENRLLLPDTYTELGLEKI